jgi:hypothetical protein
MNAVTLPLPSPAAWRRAITFTWRTWRATTRRAWVITLLIGFVISLIMLPQVFDLSREVGWQPLPMAALVVGPFAISIVMFLGWKLADAGDDTQRSRRTRLIVALLAAGAVACLLNHAIWHQLGAADLWAELAHAKGKAEKSVWLSLLANYVNVITVAGMIFAVCEVAWRRQQTQRAVEALARKQVSLEHQLLESRLAAMQAQVEPRFLFDTLVDIEALYQKDAARAAEDLDRLIAYLRAALPRLREAGSTVAAELELVRSYLAVVTSLRGGRPQLAATAADDCGDCRFYPMLLLPLIQRAVRQPSGQLPDRIAIDVRRQAQQVVIDLRIGLAGGCAEDQELARVRERLAGLYGGRASLACAEVDDATMLTLRIPAEANGKR